MPARLGVPHELRRGTNWRARALTLSFDPGEAPGGRITLTFSGDATIQLEVECIEAELKDLGLVWRTRSRPEHPGEEPGAGSEPAGSGS